MARLEALPYRVMHDDRVRAFWYEGQAGSDNMLPDTLPTWDADTPVSVSVVADVDVAGGLSDIGLEQTNSIVAALLWSSPGSRMRGLGERAHLQAANDGPASITLSCEVPGEHLAESVDFTLLLALEAPLDRPTPLSPSRPGARVWADTRNISLAGSGGRFPMQWVDFEEMALPDDAAWFLDWDPDDLHRRTGNGLCLLLNSRHQSLREALEASEPDEKAQLLFDVLRFDVGRSMLIGALRNEDLIEDRKRFEDGTLGDTIARLIETLFHDYDLASLVGTAAGNPARLEALIQDRLRLAEAF